jgi:hypothetical protein
MACSHCGASKLFSRGLCSACYHRLRRSGSVARKYVRNAGHTCSVDGCFDTAYSKSFCVKHYEKQQHPLYNTWRLIRSRYPGEVPKSWAKIAGFIEDVGERPSPKHQLRRINEDVPYSKNNIRWVVPIRKGKDSYTKEERALYVREWALRKNFGLTSADYEAMLKSQSGGCAICTAPPSGKSLHIDHCHKTGRVRGLLCIRCNRGIGHFLDSPALLKSAIEYLS